MTIVVSVSDLRVCGDPADTIATYSLGSCIAVAAYDPVAHVGGMLHFQLPSASIDPTRASQCPLMFADTGMQALLDSLAGTGAQKRRLKVKLAGAAQMLSDNTLFNIGRRNHASIRKILWQHGIFIEGEDIGGVAPRNMYLALADGAVTVKTQGKTVTL